MSEPECREWKSTVYLISLDVEKAAVLLQKETGHAYTLPNFTVEGGLWETTTAKMQEQIEPALNIKGQALYRAAYQEDKERCLGEVIIVQENQNSPSSNQDWFTLQTLAHVTLINPTHCSLIETVLSELETGQTPRQRPPWSRPGWLQEATAWMTAELAQAGWIPAAPPEMGRNWPLSYVMHIQATNGHSPQKEKERIFFKTSLDLPLFVNEAVVTDGLASFYPGHVPQPLAINPEKNWMLLSDFGEAIGHEASLEARLEILRQYSAIQKNSTRQVEDLIALGCCDRRLDWMMAQIEPLVGHPEIEKVLTAEESNQFHSMVIPLQRMCQKLFDFAIPDGLIHGDLHGGNVAGKIGEGDQLLFFDWTDSAVSHPFFDMLLIYIEKNTAEQEQMRDFYLTQWLDYEPMERLLEIWQIAEILAAVYHAVSYLYILEGLEAWGKVDLDWALPYWIRKILTNGDLIDEFR